MIELCDGLPLALRIAASRLAIRPGWAIRDLVGQGDMENDFLDVLDHGRDFGLTAALNSTRHRLSPAAARLLPLLALCDGPWADVRAAAALLGTDPAGAAAALRNLTAWNLLSELRPGRYAWPSLVGCYIRGLLAEEVTEGEVRAARARCGLSRRAQAAAHREPHGEFAGVAG